MNASDQTLWPPTPGQDPSRRFLWVLVLIGLLALIGFFAAKPVYQVIKTQRALALAAEVEAALQSAQAGQLEAAGRNLRVVLGLAPTHPTVLRLAARYCSRLVLIEGLNYWQMLLATPVATRQDQLDYLKLCVAFNRADLAGPQVRDLLATNQTDPDLLRLQVRLLRDTELPSVALQAARHWVRVRPGDEEAQFVLGSLSAASPVAAERAGGRRELWGLALGKGPFQLAAVDALVPSPELTRAESQLLLRSLSGRSDRRLAVLDLSVRLEPERRAELTDELEKTVLAVGKPAELAEAAAWFAEHGEVARVLRLLPADKVARDPILLTARLQALLETDRMAEVQPYLEQEDPPVAAHMLHCLRALAAQKAARPQLVLGHFENALAACADEPAKLRFVAGYAERIGQPRAAIAAHERLMRWPQLTYASGREALRLLGPLDDTLAVRDTLRRLAGFLPGDEPLYLADTYYGFLLGEATPQARAGLARRLAERPKELIYLFVLALGELRGGDPAKALSLIEGATVDWDRAEPRMKAIYAAALGANQQREAARQVARRIDPKALKAEERLLIKEWL